MSFRLVDSKWDDELLSAASADQNHLRIVCPFIKKGALARLLKAGQQKIIQVITRFSQTDFADGVSDIEALRLLLESGAQVRGVRKLHAKLYLFGASRAIVTSANLTGTGLMRNHELGFIAEEPAIVERCRTYFDFLWARAGNSLVPERLAAWDLKVSNYLAAGAPPCKPSGLTDEGAEVGGMGELPDLAEKLMDAPQYYVKFLGRSKKRAPLELATFEEIREAECHRILCYPASKRPAGVEEGALMFIGRMTKEPSDIRIFGRAVAMQYIPGRDDATPEDLARREWMPKWPRYIRVHHAEFLNGTMADGISLGELMNDLEAIAFAATKRNLEAGHGNTNPRTAYNQQAAVRLTPEGAAWMNHRLEAAFAKHGRVSPSKLAKLDWPEVPKIWKAGDK